MPATPYEAVCTDPESLLELLDVDVLDDVETLLMFLLARPVGLTEVWSDDGLPSLEVIMQGNDEATRTRYDFPLSIIELVRACAEPANRLGAYTAGSVAGGEAPDISALCDGDLVAALQQALGMVRLYNILEEEEQSQDPASEGGKPGPDSVTPSECPSCGASDLPYPITGEQTAPSAGSGDPAYTVRLLSEAGASLALMPVPSLLNADDPNTHVVDIELLSPDRLVRYLGRYLSRDTPARLAQAWMQAAQDQHPERTVATIQDDIAGLAVLVIESTPFDVTVEVSIKTDLEEDVADPDILAFDVARSALIDASHAIGAWPV